jgi:hypothetical protein
MRRYLVTKGSFYERLADHGDELFGDEEFAQLYSERMGRPSIPPSVMIRALLCATHDRTSDAETSRRSRVDADWKAAMGVDDDFEGIAARTFSLMRARMIAADADNALFEATLATAVTAGIFKGPLRSIIDSSPVNGAGAVQSSYELIRGFLGQVARAATLSGPTAAAVAPLLAGKATIDWQDPVARKAHLGVLVAASRAVLAEVAEVADSAVSAAAELLAQVIDQDTDEDDDGNPQIRQGVARDRVVSHSDPEMRHGRKSASRRFDGFKMDVVSDEGSELVLGVEVRAANAGDGEGAAPLLEAIRDTLAEMVPPVELGPVLADMAYSDGDVRVAVEALGMELVAKVPPVSNGGRFPKTDFYIDLDRGEVTCPAGEVTIDTRATKDHKGRAALLFVFDAQGCATCPLRPECTPAVGRTVMVGVHEARMADARAAQLDPTIIAMLRMRCKVERKIDHLQDLGMRKARYRGRRKTKLQALLAATVANFKRLAVLGAFDTGRQLAAAA